MPTNFNLAPISAEDASAEPFEEQLFTPDVVILMCGSRIWQNRRMVQGELKRLQARYGTRLLVRHGDEPNGADRMISTLCRELRIRHEEYCATTHRATSFLWVCEHMYCDITTFHIPVPRITPGPDGTIDIHWKNKNRELLLNIPVSPDEHASFYGDNTLGQQIKGKFDTSDVSEWLIFWLVQ